MMADDIMAEQAKALAGYSGKPGAQKLGYKEGLRLWLIGLPQGLDHLAGACDFARLHRSADAGPDKGSSAFDIIHWFTKSAAAIEANLPHLQSRITRNGAIWISWPKKAAKLPTDVTEDVVRATALKLDLVDVKVCAVDDVWSGLKLVIRKDRR